MTRYSLSTQAQTFLSELLALAQRTPHNKRVAWQNELLALRLDENLIQGQQLQGSTKAAASKTQQHRQRLNECQVKCEQLAADRHPAVMTLIHQEDRARDRVRWAKKDVSDGIQLRDHFMLNYRHYPTWIKRSAQATPFGFWQTWGDRITGYTRWKRKWEQCQKELKEHQQILREAQDKWNQSIQLLEQARKDWNDKNIQHVKQAQEQRQAAEQQYQVAVTAQHDADRKLERWGKDTQSKIKSLFERHGKDLAQSMRQHKSGSSYSSSSSAASDAALWMAILGSDTSSITRMAQECGYGSYGGGSFETGGSFGGGSHSSGSSDYGSSSSYDHSSSYSSSDSSSSYSSDSSSSSCSCD